MADLTSTSVADNYLKSAPGSFYGYQPQFVSITIASAKLDFTTGYTLKTSKFTKLIRALQTVGSTVIIGKPAVDGANNVLVVAFDGATLNKGAGAVTAGTYGALKDAIGDIDGTVAPGDVTIADLSIEGAAFV